MQHRNRLDSILFLRCGPEIGLLALYCEPTDKTTFNQPNYLGGVVRIGKVLTR